MKIVGFKEFCMMPFGTVFSQVGVGGLHVLKTVLGDAGDMPSDFFYRTIAPPTMGEDLDMIGSVSRWGEADYDTRFVVYDEADRVAMMELLKMGGRP